MLPKKFRDSLVVPQNDLNIAKKLLSFVIRQLRKYHHGLEHVLIGSVARGTFVGPQLKDIDALVVFDKKHENTLSEQRRWLHKTLKTMVVSDFFNAFCKQIGIAPCSEVRVQDKSIALVWNNSPNVDLVPAYRNADDSFHIWSVRENDYIPTRPLTVQQRMREARKLPENKFLGDVICVLKHLNRRLAEINIPSVWQPSDRTPAKSCFLEYILMNAFHQGTPKSLSDALVIGFKAIAENLQTPLKLVGSPLEPQTKKRVRRREKALPLFKYLYTETKRGNSRLIVDLCRE